MGLGPRIDLRVSQSLVMTQQLQQAIKLLALVQPRNRSGHRRGAGQESIARSAARGGRARAKASSSGRTREFGDEATDPTGSDELIAKLGGADDSPVDMDWREAALETDSFADVGGGIRRRGSVRLRSAGGWRDRAWPSICMASFTGIGGTIGRLAEAIVHELEETGYLETPLRPDRRGAAKQR